MLKQTIAMAIVLASTVAATAVSQESVVPPTTQGRSVEPRTMLKLTAVLSRFQGEKKIGSLPYTLTIATGERANLRMGSEVPMVTTIVGGGDKPAQTSFTYRNLGTNIDCLAGLRPIDGAFLITLTIEDTSVHLDPAQKPTVAAQKVDVPSYRTFKTNFTALMRDGQTMQNTTAADPITGEVMKLDVTLNVLK
jgi:hypothetical protein